MLTAALLSVQCVPAHADDAGDIGRDVLAPDDDYATDGYSASDWPGGAEGRSAGAANHLRAPRVRYGQVHVYDNRYVVPEGSEHQYSLGVSTESAIHAERVPLRRSFKGYSAAVADREVARGAGAGRIP